jgi:hypothetical protein
LLPAQRTRETGQESRRLQPAAAPRVSSVYIGTYTPGRCLARAPHLIQRSPRSVGLAPATAPCIQLHMLSFIQGGYKKHRQPALRKRS